MGFDMHMVSHAMDMGLDTSLLRHDDISLTAKCIIWVGGGRCMYLGITQFLGVVANNTM